MGAGSIVSRGRGGKTNRSMYAGGSLLGARCWSTISGNAICSICESRWLSDQERRKHATYRVGQRAPCDDLGLLAGRRIHCFRYSCRNLMEGGEEAEGDNEVLSPGPEALRFDFLHPSIPHETLAHPGPRASGSNCGRGRC